MTFFNADEIILKQNININLIHNFTNQFYVKNNHLWAIIQNKDLIYKNLSDSSQINYEIKYSNCLFCNISPCGTYSVFRTNEQNFIIHFTEKNPKIINLPQILNKNDKITSCSWYLTHNRLLYVFFGTDLGRIFYISVNNPDKLTILRSNDDFKIVSLSNYNINDNFLLLICSILNKNSKYSKTNFGLILNINLNENFEEKITKNLPIIYDDECLSFNDNNIISAMIGYNHIFITNPKIDLIEYSCNFTYQTIFTIEEIPRTYFIYDNFFYGIYIDNILVWKILKNNFIPFLKISIQINSNVYFDHQNKKFYITYNNILEEYLFCDPITKLPGLEYYEKLINSL